MRRGWIVVGVGLWLAGPLGGQEPPPCPDGGGSSLEPAWSAYREGRFDEASRAFRRALECPTSAVEGSVGLGYVALQAGDHATARGRFETVLEAWPENVDALVGLGLTAWRQGRADESATLAARALRLSPDHEEARDLLARAAPGEARLLSGPEDIAYPARTNGDRFEVRGADGGWQPFYVMGVNLGAALPGRHPSEFPDPDTYASWIAAMHDMGANVVRTYTIHPPAFYRALHDFNERHPDAPLWLVHGVWTELPPEHDYENAEWESAFFSEMRRVVDLVHGSAEIEHRPGHASGSYTTDVSRWVLAYIIGREWEPFSVVAFNDLRPDLISWRGRYLTLDRGTPMDVWLAKACEEIVAYETATYSAQRPVAYTNWPTLDPLEHPTETSVEEELAIRARLGEVVDLRPLEYDNDSAGLSAGAVRATEAFPAGYFASFHAYPYYPDFMILQGSYADAESRFGPSHYFGYLRDLKAAHPDMPVVIAEYGVPASLGIAHLQPQGQHHGGHTEVAMAEIDARLTREIADAGLAGGILFAWIDEWFKKNWIAIEFEIPQDRNRLWLNRLDAEQHYGVLRMEPGSGPRGATLEQRLDEWRARPVMYRDGDAVTLRGWADEGYLWLLFEGPLDRSGQRRLPAAVDIGFDIADPGAGDRRWPGGSGEPLPVGLEFVLRMDEQGLRLLADPPSNPFRLTAVRDGLPFSGREPHPVGRMGTGGSTPPVDVFVAREEQRYNRPFRSTPNADGRYEPLKVITNRARFARDGTEFLGVGYDRGVLPEGPPPDGLWQADRDEGVLEARIPWMLLNFTDPSRRRVLQDGPSAGSDTSTDAAWATIPFGTVIVEDIGVVARWREGADSRGDPTPGWAETAALARFTWDPWEQPRWRSVRRPLFDVMGRTFADLRPPVLRDRATRFVGEGR